MNGVSLTRGPTGSRKHIWSFVAAQTQSSQYSYTCPCVAAGKSTGHTRHPSLWAMNYFCDTYTNRLVYNRSEPLWSGIVWDGKGRNANTYCCSFNSPPYFYKDLCYTTSEDIEMRWFPVLHNYFGISFVELYVQ